MLFIATSLVIEAIKSADYIILTICSSVLHTKRPMGLLAESDRDESINKYKRRPPWESFKRMLRLAFYLLGLFLL